MGYPFTVVYSEKQVADPNQDSIHGVISPSAGKPRVIAQALRESYPGFEFHPPPRALGREDFYRSHAPEYVDGVFGKTRKNGFRTLSDSVNESLPYTSGAMYDACPLAQPYKPACALVSGLVTVPGKSSEI